MLSSCSSSAGEMVNRSQPASAKISPAIFFIIYSTPQGEGEGFQYHNILKQEGMINL
jgi:hypothetical protein